MQALFEKYKNQEKINDNDIKFSFVELNEIYLKTDRKTFINFMEYMTRQISENELNFDKMLFVPECYFMGAANLCYNYHAEDRFQEPEEEQEEPEFYQKQPNRKRKKMY
jgi:hypothetical protein